MAVLIKDMEMPDSCVECDFCGGMIMPDEMYVCDFPTDEAHGKDISENIENDTKPSWCPLCLSEPCEDAVSRKGCLKTLSNLMDTDGFRDGWAVSRANVKCMLKSMPSVTPKQRWILCSERMPEVGTYVLISKKALNFRSNLPNVCTAHRSCDPRSGKEEWNDMLFGKLDDDDVLAWMPLPEPYREEGDE